MSQGKVILFGIARPGFDTELASKFYTQTVSLLESSGYEVIHSGDLVTDPDDAERLAIKFKASNAAALIILHSTFSDGRFLTQIVQQLDLPILLWSIPEPEVGGRLRLNSLTGINLAASLLVLLRRTFKCVYGFPEDQATAREITSWLNAASLLPKLHQAVIAEIGNPPPGFYTSTPNALQLLKLIGTKIIHFDLEPLFQKASEVSKERYQSAIARDRSVVKGLDNLVPEHLIKSTQFNLALNDAIKEVNADAVVLRCWPEFFRDYGAAACSTLSHLNEEGIPAACESDVLGAVSMLIEFYLTGQATFLGDMVHVDYEQNTSVFWHCGVCAFSLASKSTGPVAGVQPNRNFGFALNNGLMDGPVTIARLGQGPDGLRMLIIKGTALDVPNRFLGTSVEVRLASPAQEVLDFVLMSGYEHHYAVVWQDISKELIEFCKLLQIPYSAF